MENFEDILGQLKDSSGNLKGNLHIMEEIIPIDEQMHYFEYSKHVRENQGDIDRNFLISKLFSSDHDVEDKRQCLVLLAGLGNVAAYRAIETYKSSPLEPELGNWAAMALTESRLLLDSELSGEQQFFISTGLGGHNGKLRFFSIIASRDRSNFTKLQEDIIVREFSFQFNHDKIEVEQFQVKSNYLKILLLYDIKTDIRDVFTHIIAECNEFGNFLDDRFLLTNIKQFDDHEIEQLLKKKKQ